MDTFLEQTDIESNPIYRLLVNYDLIKCIFSAVIGVEESRLQTSTLDIHAIHKRIEMHYNRSVASVSKHAQVYLDWKGLSSEQLAAYSQQVLKDIWEFVVAVMGFYQILRVLRPLTPAEKEQGNRLRELLMSMQELLPTGSASASAKGRNLEPGQDEGTQSQCV